MGRLVSKEVRVWVAVSERKNKHAHVHTSRTAIHNTQVHQQCLPSTAAAVRRGWGLHAKQGCLHTGASMETQI